MFAKHASIVTDNGDEVTCPPRRAASCLWDKKTPREEHVLSLVTTILLFPRSSRSIQYPGGMNSFSLLLVQIEAMSWQVFKVF